MLSHELERHAAASMFLASATEPAGWKTTHGVIWRAKSCTCRRKRLAQN